MREDFELSTKLLHLVGDIRIFLKWTNMINFYYKDLVNMYVAWSFTVTWEIWVLHVWYLLPCMFKNVFWFNHMYCFLFLLFLFFLPPTAGLPLGVLNLAKIKPYQRGFFCNDDSIKYPFHDSTITSTVLYTVGFTLPILSVSS